LPKFTSFSNYSLIWIDAFIVIMIDEIDEKIIRILKENSRMTYVEIGRTIGLSEGAVRNRVQSLLDTGLIKKFTINIAPSVQVRGLIMISVNPSITTSKISNLIKNLSGVERIYEVTGEYDVVVVVSSSNIEGVNKCIEDMRGIEGIVKTNTMIVLQTI
jgi:DNA-binding Lrp family transcriptional regulator